MRSLLYIYILLAFLFCCPSYTVRAAADQVWTESELALLRMQWLGSLPELSPDPSNKYADNPAAARFGQQLFFDKRYAQTELVNPDFLNIAKGYYINANRVSKREELAPAVEEMMKTEGAYVLEVCVEKEDNVFPMIPSGASVSEIRLE